MATLMCRGLQTRLEPHLVQDPTTMTALTLKLFPPHHLAYQLALEMTSSSPPQCHPVNTPPQQLLEDPKHTHTHTHTHHHQHHPISSSSSSNPNTGRALGGWSFLHALPTTTSSCQEPSRPNPEPPVYVHPLARASKLRLSPLSLELCTENLGSESSNIVAFDDGGDGGDGDPRDVSSSAKGEQTAPRPWSTRPIMSVENASQKAIPRTNINNSSNSNSFPPPLTTIANDSIRVRPHREEGRLILEAVRDPQGNRPCFRAERSHGRLRLCFFKDRSPLCFDSEELDDEGENDVEARTDDAENDVAVEEKEDEAEELSSVDGRDEEGEAEAEHDSDGGDGEEEEAMGGTHEEMVGGNLGMGMLDHHYWRERGGGNGHESSKKTLTWEPLLVASS
ncbi:hypothetical protein ACJRO7_032133 [Eucalyptus globulus]|uniref:FAF domain-containing protein n=1 Tax=Eucalyptus globulus TaxID=34317 RepID=A0ABD3JLX8_EUCGL